GVHGRGDRGLVALPLHARPEGRAHRRGRGDGRAGDGAEQCVGDDVGLGEGAGEATHEHLGRVDQPCGDAAGVHERSGEHEERDRQQREGAGAGEHALGGDEHGLLGADHGGEGDDRGEPIAIAIGAPTTMSTTTPATRMTPARAAGSTAQAPFCPDGLDGDSGEPAPAASSAASVWASSPASMTSPRPERTRSSSANRAMITPAIGRARYICSTVTGSPGIAWSQEMAIPRRPPHTRPSAANRRMETSTRIAVIRCPGRGRSRAKKSTATWPRSPKTIATEKSTSQMNRYWETVVVQPLGEASTWRVNTCHITTSTSTTNSPMLSQVRAWTILLRGAVIAAPPCRRRAHARARTGPRP